MSLRGYEDFEGNEIRSLAEQQKREHASMREQHDNRALDPSAPGGHQPLRDPLLLHEPEVSGAGDRHANSNENNDFLFSTTDKEPSQGSGTLPTNHRVNYRAVEISGNANVLLGNTYFTQRQQYPAIAAGDNAFIHQGDNNINIHVGGSTDSAAGRELRVVLQTTWRLFKSCKDEPQPFTGIADILISFRAVLQECEEVYSSLTDTPTRHQGLKDILESCQDILMELDDIVKRFENLDLQGRRTWNRVSWHSEELTDIKARLTLQTTLLSTFMSTSQFKVARKLESLLKEYKNGAREPTIISRKTIDSIDDGQRIEWRKVRKELEEYGITTEMLLANKHFIVTWIARQAADGTFGDSTVPQEELEAEFSVALEESLRSIPVQQVETTEQAPEVYGRQRKPRISPSFEDPITHMATKQDQRIAKAIPYDQYRPQNNETVQTEPYLSPTAFLSPRQPPKPKPPSKPLRWSFASWKGAEAYPRAMSPGYGRLPPSATKIISGPTNPIHNIHVVYDRTTRTFTGLPREWEDYVESIDSTSYQYLPE